MPSFSAVSLARLNTCDPRLVEVFMRVVLHYDCSILCGHRGSEEQDEALRTGRSRLRFPMSKHNRVPSIAVDAAPYPIDWDDHVRFRVFGGFVLGMATAMGIRLRWGGDWDMDWDFNDQSLIDLPHFELID
jgi:hypothetical protein